MAQQLATLFEQSTPLLIPAGLGAYSSQRVKLDGRVYGLELNWNQTAEGWFFSLLDSEDSPIMQGVRIVSNWPLLRWRKWDSRCPPGELVATDGTTDGTPPKFDDFGIDKRVQLTYFAIDG